MSEALLEDQSSLLFRNMVCEEISLNHESLGRNVNIAQSQPRHLH